MTCYKCGATIPTSDTRPSYQIIYEGRIRVLCADCYNDAVRAYYKLMSNK